MIKVDSGLSATSRKYIDLVLLKVDFKMVDDLAELSLFIWKTI